MEAGGILDRKVKQVSSEQGFYVSLLGNATLAGQGNMRATKCIEP